MKEKNYKSSKLIQRKKKIFYAKIWIVTILLLAIISGLAYFSQSQSWQIDNIEVTETKFSNREEILNLAKQELVGKKLFIFGMNNVVFMDKARISKKVMESFSAIEKIKISITGLRSIKIEAIEYLPVANWCDNEKCYYMSEKGMIFSEVRPSDFEDRVIYHDWIDGNPLGQYYVSAEAFQNLNTLLDLISQVPLDVISVNTEDGITFNLTTSVGTRLLYEIDDDPIEVANNLNAVIEKDAINRAQLGNIDYIDLRFGNKVYYKIR